jgi:hypothetical protein
VSSDFHYLSIVHEISFGGRAGVTVGTILVNLQVISALVAYHTRGMAPPTYTAGTKVTTQVWGADSIAPESKVYMHRGYLCHGTFDKAQYGSQGLLHAIQARFRPDYLLLVLLVLHPRNSLFSGVI